MWPQARGVLIRSFLYDTSFDMRGTSTGDGPRSPWSAASSCCSNPRGPALTTAHCRGVRGAASTQGAFMDPETTLSHPKAVTHSHRLRLTGGPASTPTVTN